MQFSIKSIVAIGSLIPSVLAASTIVDERAACTNPVLRKNWHSTTQAEKTSYINAVKCLATKPSKIGLSTTLYDDSRMIFLLNRQVPFLYVHRALDLRIHGVASFLPWHRYFIQVYEDHLKQCGYTGALPYWDWEAGSTNYVNISDDPIWSPTTGFGGNGNIDASNTTNRCLQNGPFTDLRPAYWELISLKKCITRQFWNLTIPGFPEWVSPNRIMFAEQYNKTVMDSVRANTFFSTFQGALQSGPHASVHTGIGGEMRRPSVSPNDPIFWLHHTQVDRVWWLWQQQNLGAREYDFTGTEYGGIASTLDYVLDMYGLAPNRTVRDYMSSRNEYQCFRY